MPDCRRQGGGDRGEKRAHPQARQPDPGDDADHSSLSNGKWSAKLKALNKGSKLLLNAAIIEDYPDSFDEGCIVARTALLTERIRDIWRGPDDPGWLG